MAINWEWKNKMGTVEVPSVNGGFCTLNIYHGNCYAVMCNEWTTDDGREQYQVSSFILDNAHLKNMVKDNCYDGWQNWRLNGYFTDSFTIAKALVKSGHTVTLYYDDLRGEKKQ